MTLKEALAHAREHQPSLLAARARIAASQAEASVPRAQWLPRVAATAQALVGTANNSTASYFSSPGVDLVRIGGSKTLESPSFTPEPSTLVGVGVRQELYDFGRISAQTAAADASVDVERRRSDVERLDLDLTVAEAFYAVQGAKAVLSTMKSAENRAKVIRDAAAAGVAQGLRRPLDQTRAEADLARAEVARVRAQSALQSAQAVFAGVVGLGDPLLDAAGDAPTPAALPTLDQAITNASNHDPGVLAAQAKLAAQQARSRAVNAEGRPDLLLSASASGRAGGTPPSSGPEVAGSGWLPVVPNYDVGVVLSWPLFDPAVRRRLDAATQLEQVRQQELAAARLRVQTQVQQAFLAATSADEAIASLERSSQAAKVNSEQAQARYQAGLATSVELAEAELLRTDAEIQLAVGQFERARARARLSRAMGEEL
jgi:outer membrane protein